MKKLNMGQIVLNIALACLAFCIFMPFVMLLSISVTSTETISNYGYSILPREFDFTAYKAIFKNSYQLIQAYKVTAIFSFVYMFLSVFMMSLMGYALARNVLKCRYKLALFLYIPTLFSGGLIPSYILITQYLHLNDTIWVYILPGLVAPYYVYMLRTFFQGLPESIVESAVLDGASEYTIFARIVVPLSKPAVASVALFMFLAKWNDWNTSMLYIDDQKLISLQYLLQRIMQNIEVLTSEASQQIGITADVPAESMRMAMAVLVAGPALIVFPFFQKYFVKGLTVGGVKG